MDNGEIKVDTVNDMEKLATGDDFEHSHIDMDNCISNRIGVNVNKEGEKLPLSIRSQTMKKTTNVLDRN